MLKFKQSMLSSKTHYYRLGIYYSSIKDKISSTYLSQGRLTLDKLLISVLRKKSMPQAKPNTFLNKCKLTNVP